MLKKLVLPALLSFGTVAAPQYISIGNDLAKALEKKQINFKVLKKNDSFSLLEVDSSIKEDASLLAHEEFHRCGGFFSYDSLTEAFEHFDDQTTFEKGTVSVQDYSITEGETVNQLIKEADEFKIRSMISHLESYHNRYYKSKTGVESSNWIYDQWSALVAHRSDASVEKFIHKKWPQPSIILTIKGQSPERIIVGGHADSIAGFWNRKHAHAPGADDNASGIATTTEIIRVLVDKNYRPKKTLTFIAYAAEEVGLLGSKEIARKYKEENEYVAGVLQLDMTNMKNGNWDIVLMTDYTNAEQNDFLGNLMDTYLPTLKWGRDKCGYGCSDHASWHSQGFSASIPFESKMSKKNNHIHTSKDTLKTMGGTAEHALKFAKLGLAYVVELDR